MNSISFSGRLGKDVELKNVSGTALAEFSVGENVGFGDRKTTNWWRCQIWGKQAQSSLMDYLNKGKEVFITGEVTLRQYEKKGEKHLSPEIRVDRISLVGGTGDKQQSAAQQPQQRSQPQHDHTQNAELDDDLPF